MIPLAVHCVLQKDMMPAGEAEEDGAALGGGCIGFELFSRARRGTLLALS